MCILIGNLTKFLGNPYYEPLLRFKAICIDITHLIAADDTNQVHNSD